MLALTLAFLLTAQVTPLIPPPLPTLPWRFQEDLPKDLKGQQIRMCPPAREGADPEMALLLLLETGNRTFLYWGMDTRWVIGEFPTVQIGAVPTRLWMGTTDPDTKALLIARGPEAFSKDTHAGLPCAWLRTP